LCDPAVDAPTDLTHACPVDVLCKEFPLGTVATLNCFGAYGETPMFWSLRRCC